MRPLILALTLVACTGEDDSVVTDDTDVVVDNAAVTDRLHRWLAGTFDSAEQAARDDNYFAVRMILCEVDLPELGDQVLYLEQAVMDDLASPYRQRFYVIEPGEVQDTAVSRIFTFGNPGAAVGLCEGGGSLPSAATASERDGCAVTMTWTGTRFEGGTTTTECATSLGGDYAASDVTIEKAQLTSWDRGFYDDGTQAWGVTGGPYEFIRRTAEPAD